MPARSLNFRVRIATPGADAVEGTVDFTLTLDDLSAPPVVTGLIARPSSGRTESRPFSVLALDHAGALTAALTDNGRWTALGRLVDVQFEAVDVGTWVTYGTGRVSMLDEAEGPGRYHIEISDESWKARRARIFESALPDAPNTTQIWPNGIRTGPAVFAGLTTEAWRGFDGAPSALGELASSAGDIHRIRLRAGGRGRAVTDALVKWLDAQAGPPETRVLPSDAVGSTNNFGPLRLRYDDIDYFVLSFGNSIDDVHFLSSLKTEAANPTSRPGSPHEISVWVHASTSPAASGLGFLYAPTVQPGPDTPLHVGLADPAHAWGTADGWIHPATLTRRYWDLTGQLYDSASLAALENDTSFPLLAPRVTEVPDDPDEWFVENVWAPSMLLALRDGQGRRKLVDMRLPADLDPDLLPLFDATNSAASSWRLSGSEAANSIVWSYEHIVERIVRPNEVAGQPEPALDGQVAEVREAEPAEGDTIDDIGRRSLKLKLLGALEPTADSVRAARVVAAGGALWGNPAAGEGATGEMSKDLLDIYQDGAFKLVGEVGRTQAETLVEGDMVLIEFGSLGLPPCL